MRWRLRVCSWGAYCPCSGSASRRASEALNSHECWRVFCDVMVSDGQLQFSVPDAVITALNREHRKEALLGADFQLKERLLNVASLVVSTPGTMWKALQKIARVFGLKATKGKATIDGKRNCFRCVEVSISPGKRLALVFLISSCALPS